MGKVSDQIAAAGEKDVLVFSADWCPFCKKVSLDSAPPTCPTPDLTQIAPDLFSGPQAVAALADAGVKHQARQTVFIYTPRPRTSPRTEVSTETVARLDTGCGLGPYYYDAQVIEIDGEIKSQLMVIGVGVAVGIAVGG